MYYKTTMESPIGKLTLGSDGKNIVGLWMEGQRFFAGTVPEEMKVHDTLDVFARTKDWIDRYFAGENPPISALSLAPMGSEFRQKVWKLLIEIPYGEVITYGELAEKITEQQGGNRMSAQAVGGAVGHNPISIIIPCHRVVGADGSLTGYGGGMDKKKFLLRLEGAEI